MRDEERRRFARTPISCGVMYRLVSDAVFMEGRGINLSGGGILFEGSAALPVGMAAEVRLEGVRGVAPALVAFIRVVRCEPSGASGYRMAGMIKGIRVG